MPGCRRSELPTDALLARYGGPDGYTDCYSLDVPGTVSLGAFVTAFYTTPLFKLERGLLGLARHGATDEEAAELGRGERDRFAAWTVEDHSESQLLMTDVKGRTRSWFMCTPAHADNATRLYFGSAVVPRGSSGGSPGEMGLAFRLTLGLHKKYSVALLNAAGRSLTRGAATGP